MKGTKPGNNMTLESRLTEKTMISISNSPGIVINSINNACSAILLYDQFALKKLEMKHITQKPGKSSTQALILRCVDGDTGAMEEIYNFYYRKIFGILYNICLDRSITEELTNDVFVTAFNKIGKLKKIESFESWLIGIALNLMRNQKRKLKMKNLDFEAVEYHISDKSEGREQDIHLEIRKAITKLPERYKKVIVLHDIHGFTHAEIGKIIGCGPGTSKSQLFKARKNLREILIDSGDVKPILKDKGEKL